MNDNILTAKKMEFVIFCIENVAIALGVSGDTVYRALTKQSNILYQYIVPEYRELHTQGKDYIVETIIRVMKERGGTL